MEKMTLENLAVMVARGFEKTATKEDLKEVEIKLETKLSKLDRRIEEIHDIVTTSQEGDITDLQRRTRVLERTVKALSKQAS